MSASQRNKGNAGERELLKLLSDELGFIVKRNLSQTRGGGADCIEIPGWSVECKRQEKLAIFSWWEQAVDQCGEGERPILFYRQSRYPWVAMMCLTSACDQYYLSGDELKPVSMSLEVACYIIRESL